MIKQKKLVTFVFIVVVVIFVAGCIQQTQVKDASSSQTEGMKSSANWRGIELTDIATGQTFKISDFKGKPILMESFAVWCPTCIEQQKIIKKLRRSEGDSVIHISLDTDPNEEAERVREHIESYGFDWYFAVSPINLTMALIDEFSQKIVFAPGTPMVLVCEDQSARLLRQGLKSAEELILEVEKGC